MFDKILIANRGEIAVRIIKTAKRLGIKTVALFSDADKNAQHSRLADEAYHLPGYSAQETYLQKEKIIAIAVEAAAEAIHPGYGFLAENADFAAACAAADLVFIGPPAEAIRAMGSKSAAKNTMQAAGVPIIPGYQGEDQSTATLLAQAERIGYPLLIKAVMGGGGKGMRVVGQSDDLPAALQQVKREARNSFNNDAVLLEKYLVAPRHIEIQVFADSHGNALHLFERDCSIQRRHQKIIEEAPAVGLPDSVRQAMGQAAVKAALAIEYCGAGTLEFLLDAQHNFYFMEMNTRLQVEHAVTEMITGLDLVEWQLRVAAGNVLPLQQQELRCHGHAIEVRLYAEDPRKQFLPQTGRIHALRLPTETSTVRVDSGIKNYDEISVHYDPMIGKIICWDASREQASRQLKHALQQCQIVGVKTNLAFLQSLLATAAYKQGNINTAFIADHDEALFAGIKEAGAAVFYIAALAVLLQQEKAADEQAACSQDPFSPWWLPDSWSLQGRQQQRLRLAYNGMEQSVLAQYVSAGHYFLEYQQQTAEVQAQWAGQQDLQIQINGKRAVAQVLLFQQELHLTYEGAHFQLQQLPFYQDRVSEESRNGSLVAPMPGTVVEVNISVGATVQPGQPLMVMEAMKMEHTIKAPQQGKIAELYYAVGDRVEEGQALLLLLTDDADD